MWREAARYEPRMGEDERRALLAEWQRALERSRGWARRTGRAPRNRRRGAGVGSDCRAPAGISPWQT